METGLHLSWDSISKVFFLIVCLYVLFVIKDIIVWFIFALILAVIFNYLIDILEQKRIPRLLSAVVLYSLVFALLGFFVYKTAPVLLNEIDDFIENLPVYLQKVSPLFEKFGVESFKSKSQLLESLRNSLDTAGSSSFGALTAIFGSVSSMVLVLAMAFFISIEKGFTIKLLGAFSPKKYHSYLFGLWGRARKKISGWFITRLIGVLFVGSLTYVVLLVLNVKYAFLLAVIAGLLDLVPIVGPLIAGVMLFSMVSLSSFVQGVFVALCFLIIQQLENNLLFPILFKKFVGVSPVLVLIALAVGAKLWGVLGAILAIPLAGVIFEVIKDYLQKKKNQTLIEAETPFTETIL